MTCLTCERKKGAQMESWPILASHNAVTQYCHTMQNKKGFIRGVANDTTIIEVHLTHIND